VAVTARFLIDTGAAARMRLTEVADRLEPLITGGLVATRATLDAEALYGDRSPAEYEQARWGLDVEQLGSDLEVAVEVAVVVQDRQSVLSCQHSGRQISDSYGAGQ
jgi:hypothetical protein